MSSNPFIRLIQYLTNDALICKILVIYFKTNLLEMFKPNLGYILSETPDPDNQKNVLYKTIFIKLMDIL